jgi:hypothetical protein
VATGGGLSLGALTLLTGCDLSDHDTVQAPHFPEAIAVKDFR